MSVAEVGDPGAGLVGRVDRNAPDWGFRRGAGELRVPGSGFRVASEL